MLVKTRKKKKMPGVNNNIFPNLVIRDLPRRRASDKHYLLARITFILTSPDQSIQEKMTKQLYCII